MKKQFFKFLILGAVALTLQTEVLAQSTTDITKLQKLSLITESINKIVEKQRLKGYLTEKADITIESDVYKDNHFYRVGDICKVGLSFDENGSIPYLGLDKELENITSLQNENQKEYMRQFLVLHEHFHCEFTGIQNPISVQGKSSVFNNKINKHLKEITPMMQGNGNKYSSYMETLNESFADVSASMALIKQYGVENKDLKYVLKVIHAQREDNFLQRSVDTHFTNFALNELFKPENMKRVVEVNSGSDFKSLALEFVNIGCEKLLIQKKDLAKGMFSIDAFQNSVIWETTKEIKKKLGIGERDSEVYWSESHRPKGRCFLVRFNT